MPLDEVDDPSQQNRCALIYLHQVDWAQVLVVIVKYTKHAPHQQRLYLCWIHKHQFQFESHRIHELTSHRPIRSDAPSQNANHLKDLLNQVVWLDLLAEVYHVLLGQLPDGHLRHFHGIVELFLGQFHLELVVILFWFVIGVSSAGSLAALARAWVRSGMSETELVDEVRIVQEVVQAEDAALPLLLEDLLVRYDVGWIDLRDDIDTIVNVSHSVSSTAYLAPLGLGVELKALRRVHLARSSSECLHLVLLGYLTSLNYLLLAQLLLSLKHFLMQD